MTMDQHFRFWGEKPLTSGKAAFRWVRHAVDFPALG